MNAQLQTPLLPPQRRARPHLYQMRPGMLFRVPPECCDVKLPHVAHLGVLALLSHGTEMVSDSTRIWCVVIGAEPADGVPGEIIGLPRDVQVERLHVVGPMALACEH